MKKAQKLLFTGSAFVVVLATQFGCAGARGTGAEVQMPPVQKAVTGPLTAGTVIESMNAGGYTYIYLEKAGQNGWVAVPVMDVKPGQEIEFLPGAEMGPFSSKSLNRTFEKIVFSAGPKAGTVSTTAPLPSGHPTIPAAAAPLPSGHPTAGAVPAAPAVKAMPELVAAPKEMIFAGKVVEALDAGNYTYLCLEKDGIQSWAAVPVTEVKVGEEVEISKGMAMGKFTSKSLNRTFENIIFSAGILPAK